MAAANASRTLADFAASLDWRDIPADVIDRAKICILDTVGVAGYGAHFPWSQGIARYAALYGTGGPCTVFGMPGLHLHAPYAALANGAFAHAFEQDSLRFPGAGVHPGAVLLPAALAIAQEVGADGRALIEAFVAGCEVMFRIGSASRHSSEGLGFHAPGLTGPYGAAIAAGRLLGLDSGRLVNALGIAGSLSSGLLAFTKAERGAEVKKLHLGRAAESGVLAARLAAEGLAGPETVLEGRFGFLETYCRDGDPGRLTGGLGSDWETRRICVKSYPCHVTAHTPVRALRGLMAEHSFGPSDVLEIRIEAAPKVLSHHNLTNPADIMQAQYSVPFCVALAMYRDPSDPRSFDAEAVSDPGIRALCRKVQLTPFPANEQPESGWHTRVRVTLRDGRSLSRDQQRFAGMPGEAMELADVRSKFLLLAQEPSGSSASAPFDRWMQLEHEISLEWCS